ncbi:hypothetical protein VN0834_05800 [Helicobacter pylori]
MQVLLAQGRNEFEVFCEGDWSSLPAGGFYVWVEYLLAGTGFALPLCIAIITGGVAILTFQDEIIEWLADKGYKCEKCGKSSFVMSKN